MFAITSLGKKPGKRHFLFSIFKRKWFFCLILFIFLLLIFEMILSIGGYFYFYVYSNLGDPKIEEDAFRILFLGESSTFTAQIGIENSYPAQVEKILQQKFLHKKIRSYNKGLGGIETTAILRNLDRNMIKYKPHLVVLMAGHNGCGLLVGGTLKDDKTFMLKGLKRLYSKSKICRLIAFIRDIFKLSSVTWGDGDFRYVQPGENRNYFRYYVYHYNYNAMCNSPQKAIFNLNTIIQIVHSYGSEIWFAGYLQPDIRDAINPVLQKIAEENNITYIGNYPEVDFVVNRSLFAGDGWHPNKEGHKLIADEITKVIIDKDLVEQANNKMK